MAKQFAHDLKQAGLLAEHLSEIDTATELHQTVRTLRLWRQIGIGPAFTKIGRRVFYSRTALLSWIASLETRPVRSRKSAA
jgi:hypothetical protein